ncbi:MAG: carbon-nitrogen hydrolase family protein [Vicinamibacterales bacterium]
MSPSSFRVAAVQASSVFMDRAASVDKACRLIAEAAGNGARLIAFPEAFIAGYPWWVWFVPSGHTHPLRAAYTELHRNAVAIPGPETAQLAEAAGRHGVTVAIGVNERNAEASDSTIFNTLLYLGADGRVAGRHRKLVPTAGERLVWGQGAEADLDVLDEPVGRVGGLLCWENYMPMARFALQAQGAHFHVAPTWDRGEPWTSSMRHVAKEGRCFVLSACQAFHKDAVPDGFALKRDYLGAVEGWLNPGLSLIANPDGKIVAGPLDSEEGILYAEVEPDQLVGPRWQLDVAGHYARPDLFELRIRNDRRPHVRAAGAPAPDAADGDGAA